MHCTSIIKKKAEILHGFCQVQENIASFFLKQYNINPFFIRKSTNEHYVTKSQFFTKGYFVTAFSSLDVRLKNESLDLSFCITLVTDPLLSAKLF